MKYIVISEELEELKNFHRKAKSTSSKARILCLILLKEEKYKNRDELSIFLGVSLSSVNRWVKTYNTSGIEGVLNIHSGGKRREIISEAIHSGLKTKLHDSTDPFLGFYDAVSWVEENYNKKLKYSTLNAYIHRHFGGKLKVPRKSHYKKDEKAVELFKKPSK